MQRQVTDPGGLSGGAEPGFSLMRAGVRARSSSGSAGSRRCGSRVWPTSSG